MQCQNFQFLLLAHNHKFLHKNHLTEARWQTKGHCPNQDTDEAETEPTAESTGKDEKTSMNMKLTVIETLGLQSKTT